MSKANYRLRNRNAIRRGFKNYGTYAAGVEKVVMVNMARAGLHALLEEHERTDSLMHHSTERNTLAYALSHDGTIVESGYHNGGGDDLPGDALEVATQIASEHSGWCAVILSDLKFGFYNVALEEDLLNAARGDIENAWSGMFESSFLIPGAITKPQ